MMTTAAAPKILGVRVDPLTADALHARIMDAVRYKRHELMLNVNVHCLNLAHENPRLFRILNDAAVVTCDGEGVRMVARRLGYHLPERLVVTQWIWDFAAFAEREGLSVFLLGAKPGVAEIAARRLTERHPGLTIAGTYHGYFDKTPGSSENESVINIINQARPNALFVCFGMPIQEYWLDDNWHRIDADVAFTGGAVLDYASGMLRRPPRWMTENGLEWLGRMLIEPRRLWRRYVIGNPKFLWRVWRHHRDEFRAARLAHN